MKTLRIGSQYLPLEIVGESTTIIAKKGAGKSNAAKVIVEAVLEHGIQVVIIDPVGHWWGLRSLFPIPVIGGQAGDIPLEPHAGKLLADVAVESGQSMVLDVSGLDSDGAMQRFAYEFGDHLYRIKQAHPSPLLLVLEEADEFAPQDTRGTNVARMVGSFARIVKRGRGRGLGVLAVTQRSASLSKNVLDQSDTLIVMRTVGPRDRKAIEDWVKYQDAAGMDEVIPSLPGLATGEAWIWTPQRDFLIRTQIKKADSLDTSESPIRGGTVVPKEMKPIDLEALGKEITDTAARVKANDPKELQKQVRELEKQVELLLAADVARVTTAAVEVETIVEVEKIVEVPAFTDEERSLLTESVELLAASNKVSGQLVGLLDIVKTRVNNATAERNENAGQATRSLPSVRRVDRPQTERDGVRASRTAIATPMPRVKQAAEGEVTGPEQRVLDALVWLQALGFQQPTKIQVGFIAGYRVGKKVGGTFANILGQLRSADLLDYPSPGLVQITDAGEALANDPAIEPSAAGMQEAVLARLNGPEKRVLEVLIDAYPEPISKQECGARAGYTVGDKVGGTFANILGRLRSLGLINYPGGQVVALEVLFP